MKYHHLAAFDHVVRSGGIRAAARSLGLTQGAVTKALRELEQSVGMPLVTRGARGVTLTEVGTHLAQRARAISMHMDAAREDVRQLRQEGAGRVRAGISAVLVETILPSVIACFRNRLPRAQLLISEATLPLSARAVRDGSLDFVVAGLGTTLGEADLISDNFAMVPKQLAVCRGNKLADTRNLAELMASPWVLPSEPTDRHDPMCGFFEAAGLEPPRDVILSTTLHGAVSIVASSDMITALPVPVLALPHVRSRVVAVPIGQKLPPSRYGIVRRADAPLAPAALLFCDLLQARAATFDAAL